MTVKIRHPVKPVTVRHPGPKPPGLKTLLFVTAAALGTASLPTASAQVAETRHGLRSLVTVHLEKGGHFTLRDADFLRRGQGERPPQGSRPPNTPVGPTPGNTPGVGGFGHPGDDPGPKWPRGRDPRKPTHGFDGKPRGAFGGSGLNPRDYHRIRRVDIHRVEEGITYADVTFKNGETRVNVPMTWNAVSGWERPGRAGEFYFFEAEEILYLEFPPY